MRWHTLVSNRVKMVEHDFLVLLVDLLLLTQNDIAFALDGATFELGVLEDVGDNVDGLRDVLAEALGVVDRLLARSVRIEVSPKILHLELEGVLGAAASTLESHMLEEVGRAVRRIRLSAGTSVYPHADSRGLCMGMRFRRDCETVREGRCFGKWAWRDCCRKRPQRYLSSPKEGNFRT